MIQVHSRGYMYVSYFSVPMIEYHDQKQLMNKRLYFGFWFQKVKHPIWWGGKTTSGSHCDGSRKLGKKITPSSLKTKKANHKWSKIHTLKSPLHPQGHVSSSKAVSPPHTAPPAGNQTLQYWSLLYISQNRYVCVYALMRIFLR